MKTLLHRIVEFFTGLTTKLANSLNLKRRAKKHILSLQDKLDAHRMVNEGGICPGES